MNDGQQEISGILLAIKISVMVTLTKKEVLKELKSLGITSLSELKSYMSEYKQYINSYDDQKTSDNKDTFGKISKDTDQS